MESSRDRSDEGLHIRQLSKRFGRLTALDTVSFTVRRGEVLGIIGPNHTSVLSGNLLNEGRFGYLNGDPVTLWEAETLSTAYTRSGSVPFTIGQSRVSDLFGHQIQFSDTLSWSRGKHYVRFGGSLVHHSSGGTGSEPGAAVLGTFTFRNTTTAPFDQLTLADVQQYSQPISFGISSYELNQWLSVAFVQDSFRMRDDLTLDLGLRYDRQTLTDATTNFAPRLGITWDPWKDGKTVLRGSAGLFYDAGLLGPALLAPELGGSTIGLFSFWNLPRGGAFFNNPALGANAPLQAGGTRWLANPGLFSYLLPAGTQLSSGGVSLTGRGDPYIIYRTLGR